MMNENGVSICEVGEERYERYYSKAAQKWLVQYDYRAEDGELFTCARKNLEACRAARDAWKERKRDAKWIHPDAEPGMDGGTL